MHFHCPVDMKFFAVRSVILKRSEIKLILYQWTHYYPNLSANVWMKNWKNWLHHRKMESFLFIIKIPLLLIRTVSSICIDRRNICPIKTRNEINCLKILKHLSVGLDPVSVSWFQNFNAQQHIRACIISHQKYSKQPLCNFSYSLQVHFKVMDNLVKN